MHAGFAKIARAKYDACLLARRACEPQDRHSPPRVGWTKIWLVMISSLVGSRMGLNATPMPRFTSFVRGTARSDTRHHDCGRMRDEARSGAGANHSLDAIAARARFLMARWRNGDAGTGNRLVSWFNSRLGLQLEPYLLVIVILGRLSPACVHRPDGEFVGPHDLVGFVRAWFQPLLDLQIERLPPEKSEYL
jgi:hypothetical protein